MAKVNHGGFMTLRAEKALSLCIEAEVMASNIYFEIQDLKAEVYDGKVKACKARKTFARLYSRACFYLRIVNKLCERFDMTADFDILRFGAYYRYFTE